MHVQKLAPCRGARQFGNFAGIEKSPETLVAGGTTFKYPVGNFRRRRHGACRPSWNGLGSGLPTLTTFVATKREEVLGGQRL
jgi:hypothetical protein